MKTSLSGFFLMKPLLKKNFFFFLKKSSRPVSCPLLCLYTQKVFFLEKYMCVYINIHAGQPLPGGYTNDRSFLIATVLAWVPQCAFKRKPKKKKKKLHTNIFFTKSVAAFDYLADHPALRKKENNLKKKKVGKRQASANKSPKRFLSSGERRGARKYKQTNQEGEIHFVAAAHMILWKKRGTPMCVHLKGTQRAEQVANCWPNTVRPSVYP